MNDGMLTVSNSEFGKLDILMEDGKELFPANDCARYWGTAIQAMQFAPIVVGA